MTAEYWSIWCGDREVVRFADPRMWALASEVARQVMELDRVVPVVPVILLAMEDEDLPPILLPPREAPVVVRCAGAGVTDDKTIREVAMIVVRDVSKFVRRELACKLGLPVLP